MCLAEQGSDAVSVFTLQSSGTKHHNDTIQLYDIRLQPTPLIFCLPELKKKRVGLQSFLLLEYYYDDTVKCSKHLTPVLK